MSEIIRILRVIEYVGERKAVEEQVANSIHGTKRVGSAGSNRGTIRITAQTLGEFPEILAITDADPIFDTVENDLLSNLIELAIKEHGWYIQPPEREGFGYLTHDEHSGKAARWMKVRHEGETISVPHWLPRYLKKEKRDGIQESEDSEG